MRRSVSRAGMSASSRPREAAAIDFGGVVMEGGGALVAERARRKADDHEGSEHGLSCSVAEMEGREDSIAHSANGLCRSFFQ